LTVVTDASDRALPTTSEAVLAALGRLDDVGARTNCIADRNDVEVMNAARQQLPAGLLNGEPITVKDWIDVAGFRCSGGEVEHADRCAATVEP